MELLRNSTVKIPGTNLEITHHGVSQPYVVNELADDGQLLYRWLSAPIIQGESSLGGNIAAAVFSTKTLTIVIEWTSDELATLNVRTRTSVRLWP